MITQVSSTGWWVRGEIYAAGQHIATYENDLPTATTFFTHSDHLGTERVETAVNGSSCETITNTAFGDGLNTSGSCDPSELRFTGKQRDWESNLDDFGARFYSSQLGRFLSTDWSAVPAPVPYANLSNPQTLNLYVIVSDNPETFADLDGHCGGDTAATSACECPPGACGGSLGQQAPKKVTDQKDGTGAGPSPTQKEVLAELKSLATQFGIPQAVVLATAQTESSLDVNAKNTNYNIDASGNKIATSIDYGVMQVNSKNIGQTAAGPDGKSFVIGSDIERLEGKC